MTALTSLSDATLVGFHTDANAGKRAADELGDEALCASAAKVARAFRDEIQRRTAALVGDQDGLDRLNAAIAGKSVADVRSERGAS